MAESTRPTDPGCLVDELARLPEQSIIDEQRLARVLQVSDRTVRRMVERGELAELRWTVGNGGGIQYSTGEEQSMDYRQIITIEPGKRSGKPCVRGMRISVSDVLEYLAAGMSEDEVLADFTELTRDDIRACLAFAAERERRLSIAP